MKISKIVWLLNRGFMMENDVDFDDMLHFVASHLGLHCLLLSHCLGMLAEMSTLQEYEKHFSGIWGHFLERPIFCYKSTKCTHT